MGASTVNRADSNVPETARTYNWTFPGSPVRIGLRLDVVQKLVAAITPLELNSSGAHPFEAGGLLLGRPGKPPTTVEICDLVAVPGVSPADGCYRLDVAELKRLREEMPSAKAGSAGLSVVGYFRSQPQGMLSLRDGELDLVQKEFRDPANVVLLVQTSTEPFNAGFLFWDSDTFTPFSFMDFPLDLDALRLAATRKPVQSANVEPVELSAVEPNDYVEAPAGPQPAAGERPKRRGRWLLAACVLLMVLAAVPAYLLRGRWLPAAAVGSPAPAAPSSLQLQVEAQGTGLNVRWDRQSPAIQQAREGRLWILESNRPPQVVGLETEELKTGHVYYQSSAERLQFRLEVVDAAGRLTRESVLALSSRPPVETPSGAQPVRDAPPPRQVRTVPIVDHAELPAPAAAPSRPSHPFTPPAAPVSRQTQEVALDAPPTMASGASVVAADHPPVSAGAVALPAAPLPQPQPVPLSVAGPLQTAPAAGASAPSGRGESYRQPFPRTLVRPTVGESVRALIQKDVEIAVRVDIDETGKVVKAEAISHDSTLGGYLEKAALSAALRSRFEPARMGDKAVPSSHVLRFTFRRP